jgi:hypothetical protein
MFIAHPTMQGHVIPVAAYPAMLSAAHGAGGAAVVPHPTSSTLTELLAPSPVVATSSLRDGGGGGKVGKVHEVAMRPYSPQHISTGSRHGPSGHSLTLSLSLSLSLMLQKTKGENFRDCSSKCEFFRDGSHNYAINYL